MKFEKLFKKIGKTIDKTIEELPEKYKENVEKPLKETLKELESLMLNEASTTIYIDNMSKENFFLEKYNRDHTVLIGIKNEKGSPIVKYAIEFAPEVDIDKEVSFEVSGENVTIKLKTAAKSDIVVKPVK